MMGNRKKRLGRFGSVQHLASAVAIAVLAVSPAIAPMASPHLDGIGLAITEAVFGEPVYAQEPPCEQPTPCMVAAEEEYQECLARNSWYGDVACWAARLLAIFSCGLEVMTN